MSPADRPLTDRDPGDENDAREARWARSEERRARRRAYWANLREEAERAIAKQERQRQRRLLLAGALISAGLFLALPARAAVDPRAPALDGVCVGVKPARALSWSAGGRVCSAVEPAADPLVFGTALRRPGRY